MTGWALPQAKGAVRARLEAIDVATGERRVLVDDSDADLWAPVVSPDGTLVAYARETISTPHEAPRVELWVVGLDGSGARRLAADWDRWPGSIVWLPDSAALLVQADDDGRGPLFRVDIATGAVARVTADDALFTDVVVSPDGSSAYALRASYTAPAHPVRIDLAAALATGIPVSAVALRAPAPLPALPGRSRRSRRPPPTARGCARGSRCPTARRTDAPAPLLLWIHGGPLGSWNAWSWRWNPWLLVAAGYAVLLPDPALSTGYGQDVHPARLGRAGATRRTPT